MTHRVTLRPSGRALECAADRPVLESALAQGVAIPYGCRTGTCGQCRGRLAAGRVDPGPLPPLGLTEDERAAGYVLLCQARPTTDLELEVQVLEGFADLKVKTLPARIERLEHLAHDVMGLWLKVPPVERLRFIAGQYLDVLLPDGRRRSFSLANAPHDDALLELHVRHVPGGAFSTQVFEQLQPRALLRIQGPLGTFVLRERSPRPILMLAGGTGFAPIKSMVEHAAATGLLDAGRRTVHLYWGARATRDLYLRALPERWAAERSGFRWTPVLSEPAPGDAWPGRTGLVHQAVLDDFADLSGYQVYACGAPIVIESAKKDFSAQCKLPEDEFYCDSFTPAVV